MKQVLLSVWTIHHFPPFLSNRKEVSSFRFVVMASGEAVLAAGAVLLHDGL